MIRNERGTKSKRVSNMRVTSRGQRPEMKWDSHHQPRWSRGPRVTSRFAHFDITTVGFGDVADVLGGNPRVGDFGPDIDWSAGLSLERGVHARLDAATHVEPRCASTIA